MRGLGADRVIDYNNEDFTRIGPVCDVVFDTVGGEVRAGSYKVLKPGGRLVWISPAPEGSRRARCRNPAARRQARPRASRAHAGADRRRRDQAAGDRRYKLADAARAHEISEGRHLQGKLVFEVR